MPRYTPQSLPVGGSRPPAQQAVNAGDTEEPTSPDHDQPAVLLGQHIRRERGMQGVQRYVVSMREHLAESEYEDLCHAMGVPTNLQPPAQSRPAAHSQHVPQVQDPPQQAANLNNMQMMQTLMQMMGGMNGMGGAPAGGTGGGMGSGMGGTGMNGMNPLLLTQMLQNGMGGNGGGMNGMNPLLLAQMLSSMQQR